MVGCGKACIHTVIPIVKGETRMSKVLIVGAGAQGAPCASILSRVDSVSEILLGDINLDFVKKVAAKIGSEKSQTLQTGRRQSG